MRPARVIVFFVCWIVQAIPRGVARSGLSFAFHLSVSNFKLLPCEGAGSCSVSRSFAFSSSRVALRHPRSVCPRCLSQCHPSGSWPNTCRNSTLSHLPTPSTNTTQPPLTTMPLHAQGLNQGTTQLSKLTWFFGARAFFCLCVCSYMHALTMPIEEKQYDTYLSAQTVRTGSGTKQKIVEDWRVLFCT